MSILQMAISTTPILLWRNRTPPLMEATQLGSLHIRPGLGHCLFLFMLLVTCFGAHNTQAFGTSSKNLGLWMSRVAGK